jgi:hypothetical protein
MNSRTSIMKARDRYIGIFSLVAMGAMIIACEAQRPIASYDDEATHESTLVRRASTNAVVDAGSVADAGPIADAWVPVDRRRFPRNSDAIQRVREWGSPFPGTQNVVVTAPGTCFEYEFTAGYPDQEEPRVECKCFPIPGEEPSCGSGLTPHFVFSSGCAHLSDICLEGSSCTNWFVCGGLLPPDSVYSL